MINNIYIFFFAGTPRKVYLQARANAESRRRYSRQQQMFPVRQRPESSVQNGDEGELSIRVAHEADDSSSDGRMRYSDLLRSSRSLAKRQYIYIRLREQACRMLRETGRASVSPYVAQKRGRQGERNSFREDDSRLTVRLWLGHPLLTVLLRELQIPHRKGQRGNEQGGRLADGSSEQLHHGSLYGRIEIGLENVHPFFSSRLRTDRESVLRDSIGLLRRRSRKGEENSFFFFLCLTPILTSVHNVTFSCFRIFWIISR